MPHRYIRIDDIYKARTLRQYKRIDADEEHPVQIAKLAANWSAAQAAADTTLQRIQAFERFGRDVERLAATFDRQAGMADDLADTIAATPVTTAREAAAKFRILLQRYGDGAGGLDQVEPIFAFLDDLEQLARGEAIAA